jgi:hypothetical protein
MLFRFTIFLFAVVLLLSCNNGSNCYESADTLMVTVFSGNKSTKIDSILVRGFRQTGTGDTLGYSTVSDTAKKVGLPLDLAADSTGFVVYANGKAGAFWVKHTMEFRLISQSCGFAPYYKLTASKQSPLIDSIRVFDSNVDPKSVENYETNGQNIKVYLHLTTP